MDKIKIGFEIGSDKDSGSELNIWENKGDYRMVIRELELNNENEMFIVTKSTNTDFVNNVATYLGIDSEHIWYCDDNTTILSILGQLQISIYLTNDVELETLGNSDTNTLATILVNYIPDTNKLQGKWASLLQFWISRRLNNRISE